ncbi:YfiR family protein [Marinilabilia salmonicolor]|uniref:YfiR family protein n=1 Tax=Marinilabilia salmonicolor TaxID=989 RepID=UPI00029A8416|nr:YfiR family protein [Marinilabilia salmonicolor]
MKKIVFLLLLSLMVTSPASSQMSQFKALFLFNFAKNVDWSDYGGTSDFVITVIGNDELAKELKGLAKIRKINNSNLVIKEVRNAEEVGDSHIIYLSATQSSLMPIIASYQKDNPVLIVADKQGLCAQGAAISFFTANGKLKFEICPRNVESHGIKISQRLLALGSVVQ